MSVAAVGGREYVNKARRLAVLGVVLLGGCGFGVQSPDLFLLTRHGGSGTLTLLVSDGGTLRCNGAAPRALPDALLIQARDVADDLDKDLAAGRLRAAARASVFSYTVRLQDGSGVFSDADARARPELARAELFAAQAAQGVCGLSG